MTESNQNQPLYKTVQDFIMDKTSELMSASCSLQRLCGRMDQVKELVKADEAAKDEIARITYTRVLEILEELRGRLGAETEPKGHA